MTYCGSMESLVGTDILFFQRLCLSDPWGPLVSCHDTVRGYEWWGLRICRVKVVRSLIVVLPELVPGLTMGPELFLQ